MDLAAAADVQAEVEPVEVGKAMVSPIVQAIAAAERSTTGEIRVHISRRRWDPDPLKRARKIFHALQMGRTRERNGVLLYVNTRLHRYAIYGDEEINRRVGQKYWEELSQALHEDLHSTHFENALAMAVRTMGLTLARFFPPSASHETHDRNELPNDVTRD